MIDYLKNRVYTFLRRSQKYTGTDNIYLAKGGFWLILGQMISMAIAFFSAVAFANWLSPAVYGDYKYILSLAELLEITTLVGVGTAVNQAVARNFEGSFYTGFKTKLKWGFLGSLAALVIAAYYFLKGDAVLPLPLIIVAIFMPLLNASHIYTAFLGGKKLFNIQIKYTVFSQIISVGAMITALLLTKNVFWLITIYFITNTSTSYFFYLLTKVKFRPNKNEDPLTTSYGKHLSVMGVISSVANRLDSLMLFNLIGPAQLAIYSFATIIPQQIENMLGNVETLVFPKLASKPQEEIKSSLLKKFWKFTLLIAGVIIISIIIIPFFYKIFFPQYLNSIHYSQVFMLSLISLPVTILGTAFKAKMMKKELYWLKAGSFMKIVLLAILIPLYGIWGAVIAVIGTEVFKAGLVLFFFFKKF